MKRERLVVALVTCLAVTGAIAKDACDVAWRFAPRSEAQKPYVDAEVSWRAGNAKTSELTLTPEWGGIDNFAQAMHDFRSTSPHQWVLDRADPTRKTVTHLPNERITVRYRVDARPADPDRDPISRRDAYSAIVAPDWFHFTGYAALAVPAQYGDETRPRLCVTVDIAMDGGWNVSSFGARQGRSATYVLTDSPERLRHAVYFGGSFDVRKRDVHGHAIWIARRGTWRFDMDAYADAAVRVISTHRAFWNDFAFPPFTIELLHTNRPSGSFGGTALENAFLMYAPDDFAVPGDAFDFLMSHEHLHTWLPRRFGSMGEEDEALRYWFSEGFTNFYTHRLLVLSGEWTLARYAETLNRVVEQYLQNSARGYDNERVKASFFINVAAGALPYQRGELLALRWHSKISAHDRNGLDTVLRALLLQQKVREDTRPPVPRATTRLLQALDSGGLLDANADVDRYIERGEQMEFGTDSLGPCFDMHVVKKQVFRLGFDPDSIKGGQLIGVEVDGPAYAVGLRDGQLIGGFGMYEGDASQDAFVQLRNETGPASEVKFRPTSGAQVDIPVYAPKVGADTDPTCRAWFGRSGSS